MRIIDIPNELLIANQKAYNCSIVEWRGVTLMYYRFETIGGDYNTDLAVCELDAEWMPIIKTNKALRLTRWSARVTTLDDPRAIVWQGRPTLIYPQGCVMQTAQGWLWACAMSLARFSTPHQTDGQWLPRYGRNTNAASSPASIIACEKNWTPFVHNEKLMLIYTINPLVVLEFNPTLEQTNEVSRVAEVSTSFWKFGDFLGGGTPLIKRGNEYVGFFHSFTNDHPHKPNCRSYHIGFYAISDREPFKITRMSRVPLMTAMPKESFDLRGPSSVWRPNCIYPCGWLERNGKVYISQGWQDCRCQILELTWAEIEKDVVDLPFDESEFDAEPPRWVGQTGAAVQTEAVKKKHKPKKAKK